MADVGRMKGYRTYTTFDEYLADQTAGNQAIIRELPRSVRRVAPHLQETSKWGNGCWVKGKENVAYVHTMPDCVQLGFFGRSVLRDPKGLLKGKGRYVRYIEFHAPSDIDERAFASLLKQTSGPG